MNSVKYIVCLVLCGLCGLKSWAQFDMHFTHYDELQAYYNPAMSGVSGKMNVVASYAMQMVGYTHAPATMLIGVDYALPSKGGLQVGLLSDKIGLFDNQRLYGGYAYGMNLWGGRLAVGVSAGMLTQKFDGSKVEMEEATDPAIPSSAIEGEVFDLGAGLCYHRNSFTVGASSTHLTAPVLELGETNELHIRRSYILYGGGNIRLKNPLLSLQPSMQLMTNLVSWRADVSLRGSYTWDEKKYYAGITYSPFTSVSILLGGEVNGVKLGYAYELFTSGVGIINGSHDLCIGYVTDVDLFKKGKNKHKSIRVL